MKFKALTTPIIVIISIVISTILFVFIFMNTERTVKADYFELSIAEPSGIAITSDGKFLWIVSDDNGHVAKTTLAGEIVREFFLPHKQFEGITLINDSLLCIIQESSNTLFFVTDKGEILKKVIIDIGKYGNDGYEGVTFNKNNGHFYLVKEKKPVELVELDPDFNIINRIKIKKFDDLSGICYNYEEDNLWVVSDEEKSIAKIALDGTILGEVKLKLPKLEGIAYNPQNRTLYMVSDELNALYVYKIAAEI